MKVEAGSLVIDKWGCVLRILEIIKTQETSLWFRTRYRVDTLCDLKFEEGRNFVNPIGLKNYHPDHVTCSQCKRKSDWEAIEYQIEKQHGHSTV